MINLYHTDMFEKVKDFEDNSIDLVLTDFPYGISFMGKAWDKTEDDFFYKVGCALLPKMKPGSFLVTTFTPRQDMLWRCLAGLERAGFKMNTSPIFWLYHSGFPKAMDISKAMDKTNGVEPGKGKLLKDRGTTESFMGKSNPQNENYDGTTFGVGKVYESIPISDEAKHWSGWKSYSLKPSVEVIITVQKPLAEKTIVGQVLKNGHGAVNVEETRIPYANETPNVGGRPLHNRGEGYGFEAQGGDAEANTLGRFPANLLVEGNPLKGESDGQNGSTTGLEPSAFKRANVYGDYTGYAKASVPAGDSGSTNRFYSLDAWAEKNNITLTEDSAFLDVPKPANSEKEFDVDNSDKYGGREPSSKADKESEVRHPTVKPFKLYSYLCRMFGKQGWVVLDPFMGSGTTGIACAKMGMNFIGIEREKEYFDIAQKRLKIYQKQTTLEAFQ